MTRRGSVVRLLLMFKSREVSLQPVCYNSVKVSDDNSIFLLGCSIVKMDLILNVKIYTPVTNFRCAFKLCNLQSWSIDSILDNDLLLVFL